MWIHLLIGATCLWQMPAGSPLSKRVYPVRDEELSSNSTMVPNGLSLPSNATSIRADISDNFSCANKSYGYYADIDNDCQIFHVCLPVTYPDGKAKTFRWSFICPDETMFSQEAFTCVRSEDMINECAESEQFYELNRNFGETVDSSYLEMFNNDTADDSTAAMGSKEQYPADMPVTTRRTTPTRRPAGYAPATATRRTVSLPLHQHEDNELLRRIPSAAASTVASTIASTIAPVPIASGVAAQKLPPARITANPSPNVVLSNVTRVQSNVAAPVKEIATSAPAAAAVAATTAMPIVRLPQIEVQPTTFAAVKITPALNNQVDTSTVKDETRVQQMPLREVPIFERIQTEMKMPMKEIPIFNRIQAEMQKPTKDIPVLFTANKTAEVTRDVPTATATPTATAIDDKLQPIESPGELIAGYAPDRIPDTDSEPFQLAATLKEIIAQFQPPRIPVRVTEPIVLGEAQPADTEDEDDNGDNAEEVSHDEVFDESEGSATVDADGGDDSTAAVTEMVETETDSPTTAASRSIRKRMENKRRRFFLFKADKDATN